MKIAILAGAVAAALTLSTAHATVRIRADSGGQIGPYLENLVALRSSGERVVIDGPCFSACTLVLSIVPGDRVCVTSRAVLGFHGARSLDDRGRFRAEPGASRLVLETYPPAVQQWIRRRGGLSSRVLLLRGRELAAMVRSCR